MTIQSIPPFPESGGVTIDQVLPYLKIKRSALYEWMKKGVFPRPRKLGSRSVWLAEEVREWFHSQPTAELGNGIVRHICR